MRDIELYRHLLGVEQPWTVSRVELSVEQQRVDVWAEHASEARFSCPTCDKPSSLYDHAAERSRRHLDCPFRLVWTGSPLAVVAAVAATLGLSVEIVRSRTRVRAVTLARRLALLVWCGALSRPNLEMAPTLGISASSACGLVARASADERLLATEIALRLPALPE